MTERERYIDKLESYIREIRDRAQTIQEDYECFVGWLEKLLEATKKSNEAEFETLTGGNSCSS